MPKHHHVSITLSSNGPHQTRQMKFIAELIFGIGPKTTVDPFGSIFFPVDDRVVLPFAREVSLQQDWGRKVTPFIGELMTKLTTDLFEQNECENGEAKARAILSSLHEELSIFIDND